ncbi:MAG: hypothetical protein ABJE95_03230 [Byssovorax sp.]
MKPPRAALLLALLGAGCAGQPVSRAKPRDLAPSIDALAPLFVTPARWDYHPPTPEGALAAAAIADGGCVFTAEGGQRWTTATASTTGAPGAITRCSGKATASELLAPEDLVSVIRRDGRPWLYTGASGALYEAAAPLAAFTRTVAPPEPFSRVAASATAVLATTYDGKLLRWDDAAGWRPAASPPRARVLDVAVAGTRALALSFPEVLFASDDSGATWAPAGAPPIGAHRLGITSDGALGAQGIFESLRWEPAPSSAFSRSKRALPTRSAAIDVEVGRGAGAPAVQGGRAALDGDRYVEAVRPDTEGDLWQLARGRLDGRLDLTPIPWSARCGSVRMGLRNKVVYAICVSLDGAEIGAVARRSRDLGSTWSGPLALTTPDTDQIFVSVSPEGSALVSGVCKTGGDPTGCKPAAPLLIRSAPPAATPTPSASASAPLPAPPKSGGLLGSSELVAMSPGAPQLTGAALLPTFSFDGHSAYFLGHRGKDEKLTLFVSHDEGETFSQRSLETRGTKTVRKPRDYDDDEGPEEAVEDYIEVDETSAIRPGEDGTVGLMVIRYRGSTYVTTDEDGRVIHEAPLPSDDAIMAGFGRRLVAITSHDGVGIAESSDGGATWDEQPAPAALGREVGRGSTAIVCSVAGCLFGETVARVGWGGLTDTGAVDPQADSSPTSAPAVLTPIVCDLAATTRWTRVEHVVGDGGARLPRLSEAMRGRSAWSMLTSNPETGAAAVISAGLPESGEGEAKVASRSLLAARGGRGRFAEALSFQMEGYAAVRVAIAVEKDGTPKPGAPLRNLDVAWENFMEGGAGRGKIADAGPLEPHDLASDGSLTPGLITVSVKSLVLAPHARPAPRTAFLVDAAGKVTSIDLPVFPDTGLEGHLDVRGDVTVDGGQPLGTAMVREESGDITAILLGRHAQDRWEISALSLAPARGDGPLLSHADWTYGSRSSIGMTSLTADRRRPRAWAAFQPLHGDGTFGAPEPLPTLFDLGDRPRPCSAADRAKSPRFESIFSSRDEVLFAGMRHPVLVNEPPTKSAVGVSAPITLLTAGAIAHGSPVAPCVAAWEAVGVAKSPVSAVIAGDLAHSWLFRVARAQGKPGQIPSEGVEYRAMTCHYDSAAAIPDTVWNERGTARIER